VTYLRLYEFQAKRIFSENGIKVPRGTIASTPSQVFDTVKEFGSPVVIKAQVLVGGRGLAGGISFPEDPYEARQAAAELIGKKLKDEYIHSVLVEEKVEFSREYYVSTTYDYKKKSHIVMASSKGGVDIEKVSSETPEDIVKLRVSSGLGLNDYRCKAVAKKIGLNGRSINSFGSLVKKLYNILIDYDATLVEINPIVMTSNGSFTALDAKILLDDSAGFRHRGLYAKLESVEVKESEGYAYRKSLAMESEIPTYIEMDGGIAIVSDGAGTGMLTFDLTKEYGGDIETYCELGGKANPDLIARALEIISCNDAVKVYLINLIGGLNRMDEMAEGIMMFLGKMKDEHDLTPNIVVRMSGTLEDEGRAILQKAGVNTYDNIYDAINESIKIAGEG
jgi:succinyl-CoA synthetase beta subunit